MKTEDSIFLQALNKKPLSTPPIWYMRQAGRYMPEYRAVRKNFKNFLDMCKNADVCCELAMQPINAFNLDVAILFSDILTIPDAMGLGVQFLEGEGPVFKNPIKTSKDVMDIPAFDPDKLSYVYKAVSNIKSELPKNIPLIGFSGSPWTLAAYSIEGKSSKSFEFTKNFIKHNEKEAHIFLNKLTDACFIYLKKQVEAGADVIQIFDSWANLLTKKDYETYSLIYIKSLISKLKNDPLTSNIQSSIFNAAQPGMGLTQNQLFAANQINNENIVKNSTKLYSDPPYVKDMFAMIPIKVSSLKSGDVYVLDGGTLQDNDRKYFGPVNITKLRIQLLNDHGDVINLNGSNWSFSFICEYLYNTKGV